MKMSTVWFGPSLWLVMAVLLGIATHDVIGYAAPLRTAPPAAFDYAQPSMLTGTLYAVGSDQTNVLFTFRRSATRSGNTVRVERRFDLPDGSTAAVENIVYICGRLVSYEMKELQAGLWGTIQIYPATNNPTMQKIVINHGRDTETRHKGTEADLANDTVIDDTLYPFILSHWDELQRGANVKFRFVSLEWEKTFGFKLAKSKESVINGNRVVWIKMEPTSLFVAEFMNPITFAIEKDGSHRLLEYIGRTTPRLKKGKTWKYADADTVFDWK